MLLRFGARTLVAATGSAAPLVGSTLAAPRRHNVMPSGKSYHPRRKLAALGLPLDHPDLIKE
jgi:hypothetical protein